MMPLHQVLPPSAALTPEGHLSLGGCDVVALAAEYGTPLVIYDEDAIRQAARAYRTALDAHAPGGQIIYASKAYFGQAALRLLREEGLSVDVASGGELYAALQAGFPPERIHLHGNAKSEQELREALAAGVGTVIVDNLAEIATLDRLAGEVGRHQEGLVRVTPGVEASTHSYIATGQRDSKFGFSIEGGAAEEAVARVRDSRSLVLTGLHCHIGSQLFDLSAYAAAAAILADFAARVDGTDLAVLDMGGGLGIAYLRDERPAPIDTLVETVAAAVREEWRRVGLPQPTLMLEPGRSIVGRAGVTLYRVTSLKDIVGVRRYVAVDGGMSDLLRPMLYGASYESLIANSADSEPNGPVRIVGKHCESGDVIIPEAVLPEVALGDLICVPATGAYGVAMASNYNGATRPAVVFVSDGDARLVTRRETYADLMAREL
ncbi:MAG TPA: diaminopimelate decarboxylase [Miltoncostaeaceae bacterium]|nr:diaminopimelate decarboxylase [Miltoncostaeaceae bacterium]